MSEHTYQCELCGVVLGVNGIRPFGPEGKLVCYKCMMKDEEEAERQFEIAIGLSEEGQGA